MTYDLASTHPTMLRPTVTPPSDRDGTAIPFLHDAQLSEEKEMVGSPPSLRSA